MSKKHQIRAYGLEIDQEKIAIAISRGLNIIQQDLKLGLTALPTSLLTMLLWHKRCKRLMRLMFFKRYGACGQTGNYYFSKLCALEDSFFSCT
jgi:hypothetical protein